MSCQSAPLVDERRDLFRGEQRRVLADRREVSTRAESWRVREPNTRALEAGARASNDVEVTMPSRWAAGWLVTHLGEPVVVGVDDQQHCVGPVVSSVGVVEASNQPRLVQPELARRQTIERLQFVSQRDHLADDLGDHRVRRQRRDASGAGEVVDAELNDVETQSVARASSSTSMNDPSLSSSMLSNTRRAPA